MILPTMNDDEKCYEVFRATTWLYNFYKDNAHDISERFRRGTKFPYFIKFSLTDDKMNKWTVVAFCRSKEHRKKRLYYTASYITYNVPPKHKKLDVNAGNGILLFDPISMQHHLDVEKETSPAPFIMDIVPHVFYRYTERYLKPEGLEDMKFHKKVESIMSRWFHFDVSADLNGDISAAKHKEESLAPYDVIMRGGGMLRGRMENVILIRFYTYISEDMMFDVQKQRQDDMTKERFEWKRLGLLK